MILCSQQITQHKVLSTDCALKEYSHLKQNIGAYLSFSVEIIVLQEKKKKCSIWFQSFTLSPKTLCLTSGVPKVHLPMDL